MHLVTLIAVSSNHVTADILNVDIGTLHVWVFMHSIYNAVQDTKIQGHVNQLKGLPEAFISFSVTLSHSVPKQ